MHLRRRLMSYTATIQRSNPTAFVFMIDQSGSMSDTLADGNTKANFVSDVLNRTLSTLIVLSTKSDGVRDYFDIGVLGYGGGYSGLSGALSSSFFNPISALEASPLRIEDRIKKSSDGIGGILEQKVKFPIWFEPKANGGTPMCDAITKVAEELATWCDSHMDSYPPTVLHITDGESTDGDPEELSNQLKQIGTNDGSILFFNVHISSVANFPNVFPASESALPDQYAKLLFRMSSELPEHLLSSAKDLEYKVDTGSRGFMFNADPINLIKFFKIGTVASNLR